MSPCGYNNEFDCAWPIECVDIDGKDRLVFYQTALQTIREESPSKRVEWGVTRGTPPCTPSLVKISSAASALASAA